jgi:cholesterol 25-hydroxylase
LVLQFLRYILALIPLDLFFIKRYKDANWKWDRWIHLQRELPENSPELGTLITHVILSFILFDFFFFFIHIAFHKVESLHKYHVTHHKHEHINGFITNNLSFVERVSLILSANFCLNIFSAHPLTRIFFIFLFLGMLVENHIGWDLPYGYDKIIGFGIMGGSKSHALHHINGDNHFQPFFTYLDFFYSKFISKKNSF